MVIVVKWRHRANSLLLPLMMQSYRYNDLPGVTMNILGKSYSKMYGTELRYIDLRYNDIPDIKIENLATERKFFLVIRHITILVSLHSHKLSKTFLNFSTRRFTLSLPLSGKVKTKWNVECSLGTLKMEDWKLHSWILLLKLKEYYAVKSSRVKTLVAGKLFFFIT